MLHATKVASSLPPHIAAPLHACGSLHPSTMLSLTVCVGVVEKPTGRVTKAHRVKCRSGACKRATRRLCWGILP